MGVERHGRRHSRDPALPRRPLVRDKSPEDLEWLEQTIRDHAEFMANPANLGH